MAIAAEQLKELTPDTQKTPYKETGLSIAVVADQLEVEFEDLRKAMALHPYHSTPFYNWKGFGATVIPP